MVNDGKPPSAADEVANRLSSIPDLADAPLEVPWLRRPTAEQLKQSETVSGDATAAMLSPPPAPPPPDTVDRITADPDAPPSVSEPDPTPAKPVAAPTGLTADATGWGDPAPAPQQDPTTVAPTPRPDADPGPSARSVGASSEATMVQPLPGNQAFTNAPVASPAPEGPGTGRPSQLRPTVPLAPDPKPVAPPQAPKPARERPKFPRRRRRRVGLRRRVRRVILAIVALLLIAFLGTVAWGYSSYRGVERVPVGDVLSPASDGFQNILLIGTDNREGIDEDNPNAAAILGEGAPEGARTDTILVLRLGDDGSQLLSLPRDLWVNQPATGENGRINGAFQRGPDELIRTVQQSVGIPVHHYIEVDFAGFLDVVDSLGGVTVDFPNPAFDTRSGLLVNEAGPVKLNSDDALAYVRSRQYTETIDGVQVRDPLSDLGRVMRQQSFLRTVFADLADVRNPITANRVAGSISSSVKTDDDLSFFAALGILRKVRGLEPEALVPPTTNFTTSGGAQVLLLGDDSDDTLDRFR